MKNKGGGLFWGKFLILGEGFVDTHHLLKRIFGDFDVEWRHEDYWFWDSLIDVGWWDSMIFGEGTQLRVTTVKKNNIKKRYENALWSSSKAMC